MNALRFFLNDKWLELSGIAPTTTLLRYLRDNQRMTGTKEGCAEGDCGACTVVVVEEDGQGRPAYRAVNSCLLLLPMLQGKRVYTVEGLRTGDVLHPSQAALMEASGSQCGYCTPGVVMALFEACYREDLREPWQLDAALCGNLCRCTGYRPIREAGQKVAGSCPQDRFAAGLAAAAPGPMGLAYSAGPQRFVTPNSLSELWDVLEANPAARLVVGGTDLSLDITKRYAEPTLLVSLEGLKALRGIRDLEDGTTWIGAGTFLTDVESWSCGRNAPLERMLRYFGARQIKNRATVGGNLCTASPIGDLAPVFLALGARFVLASRAGERRVPAEEFFLAYRKTALGPREVLAAVELPRLPAGARVASYKVSKRRELDISTVSAAFYVELNDAGRVTAARLAYGGMAATPARARSAEAAILGLPWNLEAVAAAADELGHDFTPLSDHRGSAVYRLLVARNLLRGFHDETQVTAAPRLPHPHTATAQVGGAQES
ncbi:MAG: hypothetical protein RL653_3549 [Pseudomonadota bacterium]|jgi:xanthine dehydrogenase small subunit